MGMKRIVAAVLLPLLAAPAWGQDFEKGVQAYERRDCVIAEKELRPLAEQGHAQAQYYLGQAHEFCWGYPSLPLEGAAKWYRRAAEQGHADAQLSLGYTYIFGKGVPKDIVEAVKWWHMAAEQGYADAMFALGNASYKCGGKVGWPCRVGALPVHPEYTEAARWYWLAAERGHLEAQIMIAVMYIEGLGLPQDNVMAHMWLNLAAAQAGHGTSYRNVATKSRDAVAAKMTSDQIAEAQRLAREWKPKKGPTVPGSASQ